MFIWTYIQNQNLSLAIVSLFPSCRFSTVCFDNLSFDTFLFFNYFYFDAEKVDGFVLEKRKQLYNVNTYHTDEPQLLEHDDSKLDFGFLPFI